MARPKVIVTRAWPEEAERRLTELFDVRLNRDDRPMTAAELQGALRSADAVLPTVSDKITAEVLSADPLRARILASFGVGFNHIDIRAAKARGLVVTNTPEVLTDCTADLAMTLLMMVARRAGEGERHVRDLRSQRRAAAADGDELPVLPTDGGVWTQSYSSLASTRVPASICSTDRRLSLP